MSNVIFDWMAIIASDKQTKHKADQRKASQRKAIPIVQCISDSGVSSGMNRL